MRHIKYILLVLFLIIGVRNVYAFDKTDKIYDYALILSSKEESKIKEKVDKFIDNYNIDMVIITVKHYTQDDLNSYLSEFYTQNEFGIGDNKSAIIAVISLKDEKEEVEVRTFGGATSLYSDSEIRNILNNMSKKEKYYDKLNEFIKYSDSYLVSDYAKNENILSSINFIFIITTSLIVSSVISLISFLLHKIPKYKDIDVSFVKESTLEKNTKVDKFITTNTKKKAINDRRE